MTLSKYTGTAAKLMYYIVVLFLERSFVIFISNKGKNLKRGYETTPVG